MEGSPWADTKCFPWSRRLNPRGIWAQMEWLCTSSHQAGVCPGSAPALCVLGFTGVQQRSTRGRGTHLGCPDLIQGYGLGTVWTWTGELLWEAGIQEHLSWGDQALAPPLDGNRACKLLGSYVRHYTRPSRAFLAHQGVCADVFHILSTKKC